jgi:uncharacterized protein (DUF1800 family)
MNARFLLLPAALLVVHALAQSDAPPALNLTVSNQTKVLRWSPYPHAQAYQLLSASNLTQGFAPDASGTTAPFSWATTNARQQQFYQLGITPLGSNALLSAQALNRLAYGPTPDELERIAAIGPDAWIEEQLAPENLTDNLDAYSLVTTNAVPNDPATNWLRVVATGVASGSTRSNLYLYLTGVGEVHLDDVRLVSGTNPDAGTNLIVNGDFESPLTPAWSLSANVAGSQISTQTVFQGTGSLRLVSTAAGSGDGSALRQIFAPVLTNNEIVTLSFYYRPTTNSRLLTIRLGGTGTVASGADITGPPGWVYAQATGIATANNAIYLYPSGDGMAYLDDIKLVAGTQAGVGVNLLANGGFESGRSPWQFSTEFTNSLVVSNVAFSGNSCLQIIAAGGGSGSGDSISQSGLSGIVSGNVYTVSYWYVPFTKARSLTVRLSGSGTVGLLTSTPDAGMPGLRRRLDNATAQLHHLRAWHVQNAVGARRQLLEMLLQFLENHFVTEHGKSRDYLDAYYNDSTVIDRLAADWDFRENAAWRAALLRPDCTFHDLLKISAESPAMIVYLDTVNSRGDGRNIANENYARELFELFCMGVDNGYDQFDIVAQSRAWTGWTVDLLAPGEETNPFAVRSTVYGLNPGSGYNAVSNLVGTWSMRFRSDRHGTNRAPLLTVWATNSTSTNLIALGPKLVPARFGPPWAGTSYQLAIPGRTGTNSIQDGYDVLRHLANLPMTMEYLSVKLCRLFVHEDFPNPTTRPELPEYAFYDYTNPNRSAEAELVHQCMLAWWNSNPRGQIRPVLRTIFNSELFRTRAGVSQKVKTPLEFSASVIRALRSANPDGSFTASTDGYSIAGTSRDGSKAPLTRMGNMLLFDRDAPDGYPEVGASWISAGTLAERCRFVQAALMTATDTNKNDGMNTSANGNVTDPVALLKKKLPAGSWNNAGSVADYFLGLFFPAEGAGNLTQYRQLAVDFLNTADTGIGTIPFSSLSHTSTAYDTRVRAMVAMLLTQQRFQEQ